MLRDIVELELGVIKGFDGLVGNLDFHQIIIHSQTNPVIFILESLLFLQMFLHFGSLLLQHFRPILILLFNQSKNFLGEYIFYDVI